MDLIRVLFVCTGNTCRSPMAAALFHKAAQERAALASARVEADSAGLAADAGAPAAAQAVSVMRSKGIDISRHRARAVADDAAQYDLILAMTEPHKAQLLLRFPEAAAKVYTLKEYAGAKGSLDIADPFGGDEEAYRRTLEEIGEAVEAAADRLAAEWSERKRGT